MKKYVRLGISPKNRGFTLVELLLSTGLISVVVGTLVYAQVNLMRDWQRGMNREQVERETQKALRNARQAVMEARTITVNSAGTLVTFKLPARDFSGNYTIPLEPESGSSRTLQVDWSSGELRLTQNGSTRVLLRNIVQTNNGSSYNPFTLNQYAPGMAVLHVRLSVRREASGPGHPIAYTWVEETVLLRNIQ